MLPVKYQKQHIDSTLLTRMSKVSIGCLPAHMGRQTCSKIILWQYDPQKEFAQIYHNRGKLEFMVEVTYLPDAAAAKNFSVLRIGSVVIK